MVKLHDSNSNSKSNSLCIYKQVHDWEFPIAVKINLNVLEIFNQKNSGISTWELNNLKEIEDDNEIKQNKKSAMLMDW